MNVRVWIQTDRVGSKVEEIVEVDDEEWTSMSEDEREEFCRNVAFNKMDWGWSVSENRPPPVVRLYGSSQRRRAITSILNRIRADKGMAETFSDVVSAGIQPCHGI